MRRRIAIVSMAVAALVVPAGSASAHAAAPCDDTDGDGSPSGVEFATHHIVPLAQDGMLGEGGHLPGTHMGFALCLG